MAIAAFIVCAGERSTRVKVILFEGTRFDAGA